MDLLHNLRIRDYLISLVIALLIALFFGFHKYTIFEITSYAILNSFAIGTFTNVCIIMEDFQCGQTDLMDATRLRNLVSAILAVPFIYSIALATFSLCFKQNLLLLIPDKIFSNLTINVFEFSRGVLFLWFKLLITAQAVVIGLLALEVVRSQRLAKLELKKHKDHFNKYYSKSVTSNNKFKRKLYYFWAYDLVWSQWFFISLLYLLIIFTFNTSIFNS